MTNIVNIRQTPPQFETSCLFVTNQSNEPKISILLVGLLMSMTHPILANASAGISELKKNSMAIIEHAEGAPVAILDRNRPVFYAVPAAAWESLIDKPEDLELAALMREREGEADIDIDEL